MNAADIMTVDVRTVHPEESLADAIELLSASESRHVPVVNDAGELLGILSDRDLRAFLGSYDADGETREEVSASERARRPVSEIMTREVVSLRDDTDIEDVVEQLLEAKVGAMPVLDQDNVVLGIVSYIDVLRAWQRERGAAEAPLLPSLAELEDRARVSDGQTVAPRPAGPRAAEPRRATLRKAAPRKAAPHKATPRKAPAARSASKKTSSRKAAER